MSEALSLFALSDKFRRGVSFSGNAAADLVNEAKKFIDVLSSYDPARADEEGYVSGYASQLTAAVQDIASLAAKDMRAEEVLLPLVYQADNPHSRFVRDNILDRTVFPIKVSFEKASYTKTASYFGPPDKGVPTVFDCNGAYRGIIGVKCAENNEHLGATSLRSSMPFRPSIKMEKPPVDPEALLDATEEEKSDYPGGLFGDGVKRREWFKEPPDEDFLTDGPSI